MAEVVFAKHFLATLDNRPIKLASDHVADPRKLPAQSAYILPRLSKALPSKRARTTTPSVSATASTSTKPTTTASAFVLTLTLTPLKPLSNAPDLTFPGIDANRTSVYDVKALCAARTGYTADKIKVLWGKRPVLDSKTVGEVVGDVAAVEGRADMGVMFVGQAASAPALAPAAVEKQNVDDARETAVSTEHDTTTRTEQGEPSIAQVASGLGELVTEAFWDDLGGFVLARVRDEAAAQEVTSTFRQAWQART